MEEKDPNKLLDKIRGKREYCSVPNYVLIRNANKTLKENMETLIFSDQFAFRGFVHYLSSGKNEKELPIFTVPRRSCEFSVASSDCKKFGEEIFAKNFINFANEHKESEEYLAYVFIPTIFANFVSSPYLQVFQQFFENMLNDKDGIELIPKIMLSAMLHDFPFIEFFEKSLFKQENNSSIFQKAFLDSVMFMTATLQNCFKEFIEKFGPEKFFNFIYLDFRQLIITLLGDNIDLIQQICEEAQDTGCLSMISMNIMLLNAQEEFNVGDFYDNQITQIYSVYDLALINKLTGKQTRKADEKLVDEEKYRIVTKNLNLFEFKDNSIEYSILEPPESNEDWGKKWAMIRDSINSMQQPHIPGVNENFTECDGKEETIYYLQCYLKMLNDNEESAKLIPGTIENPGRVVSHKWLKDRISSLEFVSGQIFDSIIRKIDPKSIPKKFIKDTTLTLYKAIEPPKSVFAKDTNKDKAETFWNNVLKKGNRVLLKTGSQRVFGEKFISELYKAAVRHYLSGQKLDRKKTPLDTKPVVDYPIILPDKEFYDKELNEMGRLLDFLLEDHKLLITLTAVGQLCGLFNDLFGENLLDNFKLLIAEMTFKESDSTNNKAQKIEKILTTINSAQVYIKKNGEFFIQPQLQHIAQNIDNFLTLINIKETAKRSQQTTSSI